MTAEETKIIAREAAQEAISETRGVNDLLNRLYLTLAVTSVLGAGLFFVIDSRVDSRVGPLEKEVAVMGADSNHTTDQLTEIKAMIAELRGHVMKK